MSDRLYSVHGENAYQDSVHTSREQRHEQTSARLWSRCWWSRSRDVHRWSCGGNRRFPYRAMDFEPGISAWLIRFKFLAFAALILASLMFGSSRLGKLHARDRILARLKLRGDEAVLDVGCGHGLLLIAAAKLLPRGHAVGIDLWSQWQQSDNSREATLRNAELEGVAQRVSVHDGDMRKMPFADRSFDAAARPLRHPQRSQPRRTPRSHP